MYLHADHLDTPRLATDAAQRVVWRWRSDAFGIGTAETDPDGDSVATEVPLRFPGQYFDLETGLQCNYFRDYDPGNGRYVESDPIGIRGGLNTYAYVRNRPATTVDPRGLVEWTGQGASISIIFGGGAFLDHYYLTTKCINGLQGYVEFYASGTAVGYGYEISGGGGDFTFEDGLPSIDPNVFEGEYKKVSYGLGVGFGYGGTWVTSGGAHSITPWGPTGGLDYSVWATVGHAWVVNGSVKECECTG